MAILQDNFGEDYRLYSQKFCSWEDACIFQVPGLGQMKCNDDDFTCNGHDGIPQKVVFLMCNTYTYKWCIGRFLKKKHVTFGRASADEPGFSSSWTFVQENPWWFPKLFFPEFLADIPLGYAVCYLSFRMPNDGRWPSWRFRVTTRMTFETETFWGDPKLFWHGHSPDTQKWMPRAMTGGNWPQVGSNFTPDLRGTWRSFTWCTGQLSAAATRPFSTAGQRFFL